MFGPMLGSNGAAGGQFLMDMASRMSGAPIENPAELSKLSHLPLGPERHLILNVPVGGIDNFNNTVSGWKMEQLFTLTDEQQKAVTTLRDEYQKEQQKLEDELAAQQKALSERARQLREAYELRANDVLAGADKEAKQKIDTLAKETQAKNAAAAGDLNILLQDPNNKDPRTILTTARTVHDATAKTAQESRKSLLELLPTEVRARAEELFKQDDANKPPDIGNWGGKRPGHKGGPGGKPDEKPAEPEKVKADF
jgi:hypothetical protein